MTAPTPPAVPLPFVPLLSPPGLQARDYGPAACPYPMLCVFSSIGSLHPLSVLLRGPLGAPAAQFPSPRCALSTAPSPPSLLPPNPFVSWFTKWLLSSRHLPVRFPTSQTFPPQNHGAYVFRVTCSLSRPLPALLVPPTPATFPSARLSEASPGSPPAPRGGGVPLSAACPLRSRFVPL